MKTRWLLLGCLLLATPLAAQQRGQAARPLQADRRAQLELQLLQRFTQRAANELRLDSEQRQKLGAIVRGTAADRRRLNQAGMDLRRRMVFAVRDGGTDGEFDRLLQEQRALRARDAELWTREQAQLAEVLTARQQVHFSILWLRLQEEARNLLLQRGPGLAGEPPGGPPPP